MSIYRLAIDAWESILRYLDAADLMRLITSDKILRACLKPAIRDFVVRFATTRSPTLSSLMRLFKDTSSHPRLFSISLGEYYSYLKFVPEEYSAEKWKTNFPAGLASLELRVDCSEPPFTSLLASLDTLAPRLKKLRIKGVPTNLALPQTLTYLQFGLSQLSSDAVNISSIINQLPPTLTHLKFSPSLSLKVKTKASKLPFRNLPLRLFHGSFIFSNITEEDACWSILPNTIEDLRVELFYGKNIENFEHPRNTSWKQMFPNLTSLWVPMRYLADKPLLQRTEIAFGGHVSEKQIEEIRASFPESLTSLALVENDYREVHEGLPFIVSALGDRLKTYNNGYDPLAPSEIKWLPKWENPYVRLIQTVTSPSTDIEMLAEDQNFETFCEKNHPISHLCRNATSLTPGILPASAISFLPKTISYLDFSIAAQDPLSLESASNISKLIKSNLNNQCDMENNSKIPFEMLQWPQKLTELTLRIKTHQALHLGCLPSTLKIMCIEATKSSFIKLQGGDFAHLTELSELRLFTATPLIHSLQGLPRTITIILGRYGNSIAEEVFLNPEFQNFFLNLESLDMFGCEYSADVMLYLPTSLKNLALSLSRNGACLSEKHFEKISRTKLADLSLVGHVIWPKDLSFSVFSRFMPSTLASLFLSLFDSKKNEGWEKELAPHIPTSLLRFSTPFDTLQTLVNDRIKNLKGT